MDLVDNIEKKKMALIGFQQTNLFLSAESSIKVIDMHCPKKYNSKIANVDIMAKYVCKQRRTLSDRHHYIIIWTRL